MANILKSVCTIVCIAAAVVSASATGGLKLNDGAYYSVVFGKTGASKFTIVKSNHQFNDQGDIQWGESESLAVGKYNNSYLTLGWDVLEVHTNPSMGDSDTSEAAGFFEGKATAVSIENNAINSGIPDSKMSVGLEQFLNANEKFMSSMVNISGYLPKGHPDRRIWYHVNLVQRQLSGIYEGYLSARLDGQDTFPLKQPLSIISMLMLNLGGDLEDLEGVGTCNISTTGKASPVFDKGRCSALIRLTSDKQDLFVAHDTWSSLNSMLRIYKLYDFPFKLSADEEDPIATVPAKTVSFSSYPAVLNSGDDFYVLSSGLIQLETTIGNSNKELAARFISPLSILEWIRNIVTNRLATSCVDWPKLFSRFNSGTYNNMNMCVDYNLFTPGQPIKNGTFTIAEQVPGNLRVTDLSQSLDANGYFGSYNVAYDEYIREVSGSNVNEAAYGGWFSYTETARAKIFKRDAPKVETLQDMRKLMRQCEYKIDPLSSQLDSCQYRGWTNCTPTFTSENCIATRGDLNPVDGVWAIDAFGHRNHVSTDSKISQFSTFNKNTLPADIVSGPVGELDNPGSTPDYKWSENSWAGPHAGMPDRMVWPWMHVSF